jgi:hypothetical protein
MKQLLEQIHTSEDTAFIIEDYPFGFRLRCKMRVWIESDKKKGMRVVRQTTDPRKAGEFWNAPKKSTYDTLKVLYIDSDTEHIESAGWNANYSSGNMEFLADFGDVLTEKQIHMITIHYAADIVREMGISLYDNGRAEFYAKLKEVLLDMGQDEIVKDMAV